MKNLLKVETQKFRQIMNRNIVKILDKGFSDISAGEKMLISSPEKISEFIYAIPKGVFLA